MGKGGEFWDEMEAVFGGGNVTSGYRSQEEQDALVRRGVTRARRSTHTEGTGYDLAIGAAKSEQEIRDRLAAQGLRVKRVIRETGRGRNQGTGAHWHVELDMSGSSSGAGNTSAPGRGVANPEQFLAALESKLAPESMASDGVKTSAPTTFGSDEEFQRRATAAETQLNKQGEAIDVLSAVSEVAQATQLATLAETVNESRAISNEISAGTEALRRQVQPVFQARGRIADQLDKLNTMNPLERGLRSIFDLNYDRGFLKNQLDNYDRTLAMRANDFDYMTKLHERALMEIDRRYGLDNALPGLAVKQAEEDLGIVGMRIQQTASLLGSLRDRVAGEAQIISAKALAREDMLSRIDGPTVMKLATQAKNQNGIVSFNGVEFSYGELRDRLERDEDQELNRQAHRMSIASGQMEMAEKFATNLARSLTRQQAEAAIAAGGVFNGIQLPQDVLQQVYAGHVATAQTQAESIATTLPSQVALRTATDALNQMSGIVQRTKDMFGGRGIEGAETTLRNGADMIRELIAATKRGDPPEVITALTQNIAANAAALDKSLDASLLRQAGGDKQTAGYLKSFVYGVPMDSTAAIQAVTHFAVKGSRPDGVAMTPEAKKVFQFAEQTVRQIMAEDPKIGKAALEQRVAIAVGDYTSRTVGQARLERVMGAIPGLARRANNPLGKLSDQMWNQARENASAAAYSGIANQLGVKPEEVRRMRSTGKPLDSTPESKELYDKFVSMSGNFNALEHQALIREVDELPRLTPGQRNSDYLIGFLNSNDFVKQTEAYEVGTSQSSFGDYLINPMGQGALTRFAQNEASGLQAAQADLTQADRQMGRVVAAGFQANPSARTYTILSTIPGVGKDGAKKLLPVINGFIEKNEASFLDSRGDPSKYEGPMFEFANTRALRENNLILNYLQSTKFEDPSMEAYRKAALKGWKDSATQANTFMENLIETLGM